jgi:hypothetical protein
MSHINRFQIISFLALATLATLLLFDLFPLESIIILALISILMLATIGWSWRIILLYFCTFILGPLAEYLAMHFTSQWSYANPFVFGIPLFLPFLWGNASLLIVGLNNFIGRMLK